MIMVTVLVYMQTLCKHNLQLMSCDTAGVRGECWKDIIQLASESLDVSPALLATQKLVSEILKEREGNGFDAVRTADYLQSQALLDHRLFISSLLKVLKILVSNFLL